MCRWKEAGLDCLEPVPGSVKASVKQTADAALCVEAAWQLRPSEDEALRAADIGASGVSEVRCTPLNAHETRPPWSVDKRSVPRVRQRAWQGPSGSLKGLCFISHWFAAA